jgi:hypothetical protein
MSTKPDHTHIAKYMSSGFQRIEGWCSPMLADICKIIDIHQFQRGVLGGCAEIGVHHGLFFILLNSLIEPDEKSWAIDVFDKQEQNIDNSGCGSKKKFVDNLHQFDRHGGHNVQVIECDSTVTQLSEIISNPIRFFSIDGGHTAEHTISDLRQAQLALHPEGVIILDDILNHHWLGVIEGLCTYMATKPSLIPFAIGHNKLFLCNLSYVETYASLFRASEFVTKPSVKFFGWNIVAV